MKKLLISLVLAVAFLPFTTKAQTIAASATAIDELSVCDSLQWIDGNTYKADTNVFYTANDTLHVLILAVNHSYNLEESPVTAGCFYEWNGTIYTEDGTYKDTLSTTAQCDSIVTISITLTKIERDTLDSVYACGQYEWAGRTLTQSGNYSDTTIDATTSCKTIEVLPLVITNIIRTNSEATECGSYLWRGTRHTASNTYYDTVRNEGCDSTFTLQLTIYSLKDTLDSVASCGKYMWDKSGSYCEATGWYNADVTDPATLCLTQYSVYVSVTKLDTIEHVTDTMRCDNISYRFAKDPTVSGDNPKMLVVYSDSVAQKMFNHTTDFCHDSLSIVNFIVKKSVNDTTDMEACDEYVWEEKHKTYTQNATDTLMFKRGAANGCDSISVLNLTVSPTPKIQSLEGHWRLANPGETATLYAICDQEDVTYTWYYNNAMSNADTLVIPNVYENTDVNLSIENEASHCVAEAWITVLVGVGIDDVETIQVSLYPNPTTKKLNIETESALREVAIFNMIGQQVMRSEENGTKATLDLSALSNGTYTMRLVLQDGTFVNRKFVVSK